MDVALIKRLRSTEVLLRRALERLPEATDAVKVELSEVTASALHYLEHNELGLAFEDISGAAELVSAPGGVWRDLERAARLMNLHPEAERVHRRYLSAIRA